MNLTLHERSILKYARRNPGYHQVNAASIATISAIDKLERLHLVRVLRNKSVLLFAASGIISDKSRAIVEALSKIFGRNVELSAGYIDRVKLNKGERNIYG